MNLMSMLYYTYEYAAESGDEKFLENYLLSHMVTDAPIVIWLTEEGEFAEASYIEDKKMQKICIPCTEKSAGRSGIKPVSHPLSDKLLYLAGDGEAFGVKNEKAYEAYMHNLQAWCESTHANRYVQVVYQYLKKKTLLYDLKECDFLNESRPQEWEKRLKAVVRFGIRQDFKAGVELWKEKSIREDFIAYLGETEETKGLCYISGKEAALSENHPKSIWNLNANAKLISANEKANRGFVFSGRFTTSSEAVQISYEASQKIHNALKWLIQKQGKIIGSKMFLAWGCRGMDLSDVCEDTDLGLDEDAVSNNAETEAEFAKRIHRSILKRREDLSHNELVGFLFLEAATPGRLSISYYQEFMQVQFSELLRNIEEWHRSHVWNYRGSFDTEKNKWREVLKTPSIKEIAMFAAGTDRNGKMEADEKVLGNIVERLLPCVIEGKEVPKDIKRQLLSKAYYPQRYHMANWRKLMKLVCSLTRTDYFEEGCKVAVNKETKDIHYNYGRWLAVTHAIESGALSQSGDKRETSAVRYFTKFAENPCKFMKIIEDKTIIYERKMGAKIKKLLDTRREISANLSANPVEELMEVRHLDGRMILGFEAQLNEIWPGDKENQKNQENQNSEEE